MYGRPETRYIVCMHSIAVQTRSPRCPSLFIQGDTDMNAPTESGLKSRYDATDLITQEVLKRYADTPDPRLREIMLSLIRHIHSFAKDVKLTSGEWLYAMNLLEETGKWCGPGRNEFIIFSDALGLSMLTVTQAARA